MLKRVSPLDMGLDAERVLARNGWEIPLAYVGERPGSAVFVTDLSHVPKWSVNGWDLDGERPAGLSMPAKPGMVALDKGLLLVRTIPSECRVLALGDEVPAFEDKSFTDVTDAYAAMAVVGARCFDILGKLSSIDLEGPSSPKAALAPVEDITCMLVRMEGKDGVPGLIAACARGYGHFLLDALLDAGGEYSIRAAGWERFSNWIAGAASSVEQKKPAAVSAGRKRRR